MLHDYEIRDDLCLYLEQKYKEVRFFDELIIGKSRADIVMVTREAIYGIEIKSDADTYTRLAKQVKNYNRFFDYNILAIGSTHALHAPEHVPANWGIISIEEIDGKLDFYDLREPSITKAKLKTQLGLLWRREISEIQEMNKLHKYAGKSRKFVEEYVLEKVEPELLKKQIIDILFERDYTVFEEKDC